MKVTVNGIGSETERDRDKTVENEQVCVCVQIFNRSAEHYLLVQYIMPTVGEAIYRFHRTKLT